MKYACIIRGHLGSVVCCLLIQSQEKLAAVLKSTQFQNISSENHNDQLLSNYELFSLFHWTSCFYLTWFWNWVDFKTADTLPD